MLMRRWEPFGDMRRMRCNMDHRFRDFYPRQGQTRFPEQWAIPLDVVEEDDKVFVHASVPGVDPEAIEVFVKSHVLTIKGQTRQEREGEEGDYVMRERHGGTFYRALRLPDTLDVDNAASGYRNGVLTVTFPKAEAKQVKRLPVAFAEVAEA